MWAALYSPPMKRIAPLAAALALLVLASCNSNSPEPTPTPDSPRYTAKQVRNVAFANRDRFVYCGTWTYRGAGIWICGGGRLFDGRAPWAFFDERTGQLSGSAR